MGNLVNNTVFTKVSIEFTMAFHIELENSLKQFSIGIYFPLEENIKITII